MVITIMPFVQSSAAAVSYQESAIRPRYGMTYTETESKGAEWETTAHVSIGDNKLNNMLSSITVGILASYLASILPIPEQVQVAAGAIIGGVPHCLRIVTHYIITPLLIVELREQALSIISFLYIFIMIKSALFWLIILSIMALKRRDLFFNLCHTVG